MEPSENEPQPRTFRMPILRCSRLEHFGLVYCRFLCWLFTVLGFIGGVIKLFEGEIWEGVSIILSLPIIIAIAAILGFIIDYAENG